jgi:phosphonate transport system substrate-binding protein
MTIRRTLRFLPVLTWALLLCGPQGAAADAPVFRLGVVNERSEQPDLALQQYGSLVAYLADVLGRKGIAVSRLVIAHDVPDMLRRVAGGEVDAVIEGVFPTLWIAQRTHALDPALLAWRKGQREYRSVFFVRKDSPLRSLDDLRGRLLALEAPRSTSAFALPLATLQLHGLRATPEGGEAGHGAAVRYVLAGSEANQGYWVLRGRADAGAFNDGDWQRLPDQVRAELRIVHTTAPLLRWLVSFRKGLAPDVRRAVQAAMVDMHRSEPGRAALRQAERTARFEPLTPADGASLARWQPVLSQVSFATP